MKPTPTSPRAKKVRVRLMWSTDQFFSRPSIVEKLVRDEGALFRFKIRTVTIDISDMEALVEQVAQVSADRYWKKRNAAIGVKDSEFARAVLRSIGITKAKR